MYISDQTAVLLYFCLVQRKATGQVGDIKGYSDSIVFTRGSVCRAFRPLSENMATYLKSKVRDSELESGVLILVQLGATLQDGPKL